MSNQAEEAAKEEAFRTWVDILHAKEQAEEEAFQTWQTTGIALRGVRPPRVKKQ